MSMRKWIGHEELKAQGPGKYKFLYWTGTEKYGTQDGVAYVNLYKRYGIACNMHDRDAYWFKRSIRGFEVIEKKEKIKLNLKDFVSA